MLRRLGIRGKVLAALAVPVLVLFCAASLISVQSVQDSRVASSVNALVGVSDEMGNFTRALQDERKDTLASLADPKGDESDIHLGVARQVPLLDSCPVGCEPMTSQRHKTV